MAAPNLTISSPGQANNAGDPKALYLKMFAGETLGAFNETNVMLGRHTVRTIKSGKSAQFPATWKAEAGYHTRGQMIVGDEIGHNERVIVIDDMAYAAVSLADYDDAMSHYDVRSEYAKQLGAALSRMVDRNLLQVGVLAARASATVTGANGGTVISGADIGTDAQALVDASFAAAKAMDEKDVPKSDRYLFLAPNEYYDLINSDTKALHRDYNAGDNGSISAGNVFRLAGFEIVQTNNLPTTAVTTGPTAYQGDFSLTKALAMHRSAIGTVKLIDLAVESDYLLQNLATLVVARMAVGHGILRPESAVEIASV